MLTISAVALWEIAIKVSTGCLDADLEALGSTISNAGIPMLNPSLAHAIALRDLPLHHRDPFDRLLIAQAQVEGLTLVSADRAFGAYDVPVLWAG